MGIKSLTMATRLLDIKTTRKAYLSANKEKPACPETNEGTFLERISPEKVGVSPALIADFLNEICDDETLNLHDILIVKDGKLITEAYFGVNKKGLWKATFSACKSITSLAIGVLIDRELLSLDTRLVDIFEKELSAINKLKMKNMTVENLLTMKSGMASFDEISAVCEENLFESFVNTSLSFEPDKKFKYNSLNTYMLSAIVKKVSGKGLCEFLDENIFSFLGIKNYYWEKCKNGIELGGWGLYMLPEDMAKLGVLVMNCGVYEGKRLVSEEYIRKASSSKADVHEEIDGFDYGYQMWCSPDCSQFLFNGMLGQNVWGFRNNGIVIVNNSGNEELFQHSNYFDIVRRYFDRDFPQKASTNGKAELKKALKRASNIQNIKLTKKLTLPKECYDLDGKRFITEDTRANTMGLMPLVWQSVQNNYSKGFEKLEFELKQGRLYFNYFESGDFHSLPVGFSEPCYSDQYFDGAPYLVSCIGAFSTDEDNKKVLKLRVDFVETPCSIEIKIHFGKSKSVFGYKEFPGRVIVSDKLEDTKKEIEARPIISGVATILDDDIIKYCIERLFEYEIVLLEEK